jgi:hypothetical protein
MKLHFPQNLIMFSSCFFTCFPQNYPACQLQSAFNFPGVSLTDQLHAPQQHRITYHGCTGSLGTAWMVKWQLLPDTSVKRVFGCLGWRKNAYARLLNVTLLIIFMFSPWKRLHKETYQWVTCFTARYECFKNLAGMKKVERRGTTDHFR